MNKYVPSVLIDPAEVTKAAEIISDAFELHSIPIEIGALAMTLLLAKLKERGIVIELKALDLGPAN